MSNNKCNKEVGENRTSSATDTAGNCDDENLSGSPSLSASASRRSDNQAPSERPPASLTADLWALLDQVDPSQLVPLPSSSSSAATGQTQQGSAAGSSVVPATGSAGQSQGNVFSPGIRQIHGLSFEGWDCIAVGTSRCEVCNQRATTGAFRCTSCSFTVCVGCLRRQTSRKEHNCGMGMPLSGGHQPSIGSQTSQQAPAASSITVGTRTFARQQPPRPPKKPRKTKKADQAAATLPRSAGTFPSKEANGAATVATGSGQTVQVGGRIEGTLRNSLRVGVPAGSGHRATGRRPGKRGRINVEDEEDEDEDSKDEGS